MCTDAPLAVRCRGSTKTYDVSGRPVWRDGAFFLLISVCRAEAGRDREVGHVARPSCLFVFSFFPPSANR